MQGFIHILKLNNNVTITKDIEHLLHEYKTKSLFTHENQSENLRSIYFTNEYTEYPYGSTDSVMFTPAGVFTRSIDEVKNSIINKSTQNKIKYVKELEGQFAVGYSDFKKKEIILFTHIARIETLYSYVTDDVIIVGTDPLIISLISTNAKVQFDVSAMHSFILNGYYADDKTPFYNVFALPGNSFIKVSESGIHIEPIDDLDSTFLTKSYNKSDYDNLTDTFLNAFNSQPEKSDYKMALTGGKDSRLIFAGMRAKNINLSLFTNGFEDNPDVVIAKDIAHLYNIEHRVVSPKISSENTISINIYEKIKRIMLSTSGMVYGYENVSKLGNFKGHRSFDGVGAELVKGGFSSFINSDENSNKSSLVHIFNKNSQYLKNGSINPFSIFLNEFIDSSHGLNKLQILYSLMYRTGRLTSAAKNASNYTHQSHSPFLDNKFLKEALKIQYIDNKNEEIHYQIIKRLDRRLIDIPFAKDRWRVEKSKPLYPNDYYNWLSRQPYYPSTILGNYNWRQLHNNDEVIIEQFKNILLFNSNHLVYKIVDYNAIKNIFSQDIKPVHMRLIWSIASIIIFVNELTEVSNKPFKKVISLKLPSTSITKFKKKKRIVDITNKFLPLNKSISIDSDQIITINNFEKHRKLKLFDGKFTEAPEEINLNDISNISIKLYIEHPNLKLDFSSHILFFKNRNRAKTQQLNQQQHDGYTEFNFEIQKNDDFDSFRITLNFNKLKINESLKLSYAFYELTY